MLISAVALTLAGCHRRPTEADGGLGGAPPLASSAASARDGAAPGPREREKIPGGEVHGSVHAELGPGAADRIALPDVSVHVKNVDTGTTSAPAQTNTDGYYRLARQSPGRYELCWAAPGFGQGCNPKTFTISSGTAYPGPTALSPSLTPEPGKPRPIVIRGRAVLKSGEPCRVADAYFGVDEVARVTAIGLDKKPLGPAVRANTRGDYVLAGVPAGTTVRVGCQGAEVLGKVKAQAGTRAFALAESTLGNSGPHLASVKATVGDQEARVVPPGTQVTLAASATDPDGDKLQFHWKAPAGVLTPQGEKAVWTAPARPGTYDVYLLVMDGKGGSRSAHINVRVAPAGSNVTAPATTCSVTGGPSCVKTAGVPATTNPFLDFGAFDGGGTPAGADAYYKLVDPKGLRATLGGFWSTNGFDDPATGKGNLSAAFLNGNDLGFGRDMECQQNAANVACCVSNYSGNGTCPDQCAASADLAFQRDQSQVIATVCMEYSPIEGAPAGASGLLRDVVKFYVYADAGGGAQTSTPRQGAANLDGTTPKNVPNLCIGCHGGSYDPGSPTADVGASFREFDPHTYQYPSKAPYAAQASALFQLNQLVRFTGPADGIQELIGGLYPGGAASYDPAFVPVGWRADANEAGLYSGVVANSCRTCHAAFGGLDWTSYPLFADYQSLIQDYVCSPTSTTTMPQSLITYYNFWNNYFALAAPEPDQLASFSEAAPQPPWVAFGSCP